MELKDRERKIDITKMDAESVDNLSVQIGDKVRQICDDAAAKVNAILNIYGASAKIGIVFDGLPENKQNKIKKSTKRKAKAKAE